jgi:DNA-directed RNA polymerase III subunit RPC8
MYDLLKASDGLIGHGTGNVNVNVEFRVIVFRPFKHEIILGKICSSSRDGIQISTDFFEDIHVPPSMLFEGSEFDENENVWVWRNQEHGEFYYDIGEVVRVRVEAEEWHDQAPKKPMKTETGEMIEPRKAPYSITASMMEGGLGVVTWW